MSAINFSVSSNVIQQLEPALHALGPRQFSHAVSAASKRASTAASKTARTEIPTKWTVQKSFVRNDVIKVRNSGGAWEIYSRGARLSSLAFTTNPKRGADTTGSRRQPIFMQCYTGKTPGYIPRSWLWSRHGGVHLARKKVAGNGPRGGKLMEIKGPAVPQMMASESVREPVVDVLLTTFENRLRHEYEFRLSKAMGGK